ncbi:AfsR/SARP family transcriptional regulator [Amycolatopsis sp.]|uniref:AfsR/SARP family transcriptional regulator n=1 Tax=Amycolatopsis sp. TaxID=37632 RepID=UPI002BEA8228|nr:BTAD domain-containing putative transcriptional regulator [Amycolatopsis sp.]HVV12745.1 BTAD domain-containing putative transcriptional regulator [Amycolatopsis sp.]
MHYHLLGPVELSGPGGPVRLGGPKQRAVLAALLLNANRVVPDQQLISLVWGGDPPASVRGQVQVYVSELRKLIGRNVIVRRSPGYYIEVGPGELDVHAFDEAVASARSDRTAGLVDAAADRLRAALALWRGPALGGVTEALAAREVPGLEERRLAALEDYFDAQLTSGQHAAAVRELLQAAEENPFRERLQAQLMLALHRSGRTSEALDVYGVARARLVSELGVEPGRLLQDTQLQLLRAEEQSQPAAPAATTVPRQLPADMPQFAGRDKDLALLNELLPPDGSPAPTTVTVWGGAGVGKTTFAVHWAHQVRDRFPDGQLYVNLRAFDSGGAAVTPDEAVRGFLDALDVSTQVSTASPEAQFALYRSLLADKRMLIVLDNASDAEQVRPLLPGAPGCLTVVTSRNQLSSLVAADGAYAVNLDLLPTAEVRELLARRLGRCRVEAEPKAVEEISELCARLPLALAIVAARAATNPGFSLAALADELRAARGGLDAFDGGDPTTDVRAVFSWSYQAVSPEAARLFRLLGLHPGPHVSTPAAASLLGVPTREVRVLLAELTRAHLAVERSPGRYTFHDLLRSYAIELTRAYDSESERHAATRRMLSHYLHTAHTAARVFSPQREPIVLEPAQPGVISEPMTDEQAAVWFGAEYPVLLAVVQLAVEQGFDAHAWQLACALTNTFHHQVGHWLGELSTYQSALHAAMRAGDPTGEAHSHRGLAVFYLAMDRTDESLAQLTLALDLFVRLGDPVYQADVHQAMGWIHDRQDRPAQSLHHALRALELFRSAGHRIGEAGALNNAGWSYARLGQHEQAIIYCERALAIQEELGNVVGQASTWDTLGLAHHNLQRYDHAVECYQESIKRSRQVRSRFHEARTLGRLGESHLALGATDAARRDWREALRILDELRAPGAPEIRARLAAVEEPSRPIA